MVFIYSGAWCFYWIGFAGLWLLLDGIWFFVIMVLPARGPYKSLPKIIYITISPQVQEKTVDSLTRRVRAAITTLRSQTTCVDHHVQEENQSNKARFVHFQVRQPIIGQSLPMTSSPDFFPQMISKLSDLRFRMAPANVHGFWRCRTGSRSIHLDQVWTQAAELSRWGWC